MNNFKHLSKYGLISGLVIVFSWWVFQEIFGENSTSNSSEIAGYAAMVLSLSLIFFGVRSLREKEYDGAISFMQAFKAGMVVVSIASIIYVIGWEFYYPRFMADFGEQYANQTIEKYAAEGISSEELNAKKQELDRWIKNYNNPLIRMPMTLMEIFPVGLIIALFSALILKKSVVPDPE